MNGQGKLANLAALIIDMDGVLWRGSTSLPGVTEFFAFMRERGLRFILATNNATASASAVKERLSGMGIEIDPHEVLTSAQATSTWLQHQISPDSAVFVIGEQGLREALIEIGFRLSPSAKGVRAVVVGMDREANWAKLAEAALAIQAGALFVGTNPDPSFPVEQGLVPGNGALLAALTATTGARPVIIGKPEPHLYHQALAALHSTPQETLILGDRIETDILGGQQAGLQTGLLLTGVASREELAKSSILPDWVFDDLFHCMRVLQEEML